MRKMKAQGQGVLKPHTEKKVAAPLHVRHVPCKRNVPAGGAHMRGLLGRGALASIRLEPMLLLGKAIDKHVDEHAHLGAQVPSVGIKRVDLDLLRPVAGQQRHQRPRGQQIPDQERRGYHQTDAGHGGGAHCIGAAADQASRYARHQRIAASIQKVPPVRERRVGIAQTVVIGEVCRGLRRWMFCEVGRGAAQHQAQRREPPSDEGCVGGQAPAATSATIVNESAGITAGAVPAVMKLEIRNK